MPMKGNNHQFGISFIASMVAGMTMLLLQKTTLSQSVTFPVSSFFQPESVSSLADSLPNTSEEEFVSAAWDYVGSRIPYEAIGSDLYIQGDLCTCEDCYLGVSAIIRGKGNCVSKSSLLASILTNRVPKDRVAIVIGEVFNSVGVSGGGHCWVEYMAPDGTWYVLESTIPPRGWIPVAMVSSQYIPSFILVDGSYQCDDPNMCATVTKLSVGCNCQATVLRIAARFGP